MNARELLRQATGLDLSEATVAHAIRRRLRVLDLDDALAYEALLEGPELANLVEEVVVPESWMFRDPEAFVQMVAFVQERLRAAPQRIVRILSVPCAGGEEPYSMAIALQEAGVPQEACRIDGIDVSAAVLERARAGRFTRNAFRGAEQSFRERYFHLDGGIYQIDPTLRSQVRFRQANLLELEPGEERYDVIFCRNLLIYFDAATVTRAIARLSALLHDDGMVFAGYAEVPAYIRNGFVNVRAPGAFALRKAGAAGQAPPSMPPGPAPVAASLPAAWAAAPPPPRMAPPPARERPAASPAPRPAAADPAARLQEARRLADSGELGAAAALCRAILLELPDCAEAHYLLGIVSEPSDERAAALHYRRCIYLQPDHYEALCHLALLCEHGGDMSAAAAFKQRAARVFTRRAGPE